MSGLAPEDRRWLDAAVRFARPYLGATGGRPLAAALVVDETTGLVLGRAVTGADGADAVGVALAEAGNSAYGRTLYVTLEPQPEPVIAAGVARVVIGAKDPDPLRRGRAGTALLDAGIEVAAADHAPSAELLESYAKRVGSGLPFVTLRLAVSRDGMIARRDGAPAALMGGQAARWAAMQRALSDAVMIGARTAALDDPRLDVGLRGFENRAHARVIAVGSGHLPARLKLTDWISGHPTFVAAAEGRDLELPPLVELLRVPGRNGRPDLRRALALLAGRNISALLVEGGATLTEGLLAAELVDRFHLIDCAAGIGREGLPATPLGGIEGRLRAAGLVEVSRSEMGGDTLRTFEPEF